jgi:sugar phosphate isomerase/epimerase
MTGTRPCTRRRFLRWAGTIGSGCAATPLCALAAGNAGRLPPAAVFSKVYQELKLDFEQSARLTAEAGLDGIDCTVRPGGQIEPAEAADRLPQYARALAGHGVGLLLAATAIQGLDSPYARPILETARRLGVGYYRLGFWRHQPGLSPGRRCALIRSALKELAALNRRWGLCALFQNHSSPGTEAGAIVGGDLDELYRIVADFNPDQIGVAFDLGHALITHGDQWRPRFQRLREHVRAVYVKDVKRPAQFVRFGEGEFGRTGFFPWLARLNCRAPLSIHVEYDWAPPGGKGHAALLETLRHSRKMLGRWWRGEG